MTTKHETVETAIKTAAIDSGIVPVVRWLNSFVDVQTYASCEGFDDGELIFESDEHWEGVDKTARRLFEAPFRAPYVLFRCDSLGTLHSILSLMRTNHGGSYAEVEVSLQDAASPERSRLAFRAAFRSKDALRSFISERLPHFAGVKSTATQ